MIRRPPRSTLFPTRRSSDLSSRQKRDMRICQYFCVGGQEGTIMDARGGHNDCSLLTDRKSTRLNSSHTVISYAVFCLKKKKKKNSTQRKIQGKKQNESTPT